MKICCYVAVGFKLEGDRYLTFATPSGDVASASITILPEERRKLVEDLKTNDHVTIHGDMVKVSSVWRAWSTTGFAIKSLHWKIGDGKTWLTHVFVEEPLMTALLNVLSV